MKSGLSSVGDLTACTYNLARSFVANGRNVGQLPFGPMRARAVRRAVNCGCFGVCGSLVQVPPSQHSPGRVRIPGLQPGTSRTRPSPARQRGVDATGRNHAVRALEPHALWLALPHQADADLARQRTATPESPPPISSPGSRRQAPRNCFEGFEFTSAAGTQARRVMVSIPA